MPYFKAELKELTHFLKYAGLLWVKSNEVYATLVDLPL